MKFTAVLLAALAVSSSWAVKVNNKAEEPKDKREAPVGYPSLSSHGYQAQAAGHDDGNSISIGAGYSVGGAKPTYSLGGHDAGQLQLSGEGLPGNSHGTIQLAPITLQPGHGYQTSDLSQLMSQLAHGLNSGQLTLQSGDSYQQGHGAGQELSLQQYALGSPQLQQYTVGEQPSVPSYAAGTKGLGSYSTGPVLFSPSDAHANAPALTYNAPSSGHSFGGVSSAEHAYAPSSGHSFGGLSSGGHAFGDGGLSHGGSGYSLSGLNLGGAGHSLGGAGHSFGGAGHSLGGAGHSLGGSGHSLGGAGHSHGGLVHSSGGAGHSFGGAAHSLSGGGHSLGGAGHSLGGSGHSLGGAGHSFGGSIKGLNVGYGAPSKNSFKPSAFLGASVQSESGHGVSSFSGSYGQPSFAGFGSGSHGGLSLGSAEHGASLGGSFGGFGGGSSKFIAPSYAPSKSSGFGSSLESLGSFSSDGHFASPPGTTYGVPTSSYGVPSTATHAASNASPQYYVPMKHHGFGGSSSSFKAPASGHSSLSSYSSGPKHSFSSYSPSSRYGAVKDTHGAQSETTYNTIKYSEELKPRAH